MDEPASNLFRYPGHEILAGEIVRAENCHLYDAAGKRYVDLESGVWCTSIGHGHPRILGAITEQAGRIAHTGFAYSNGIVEDAAREILALLGFEGGRCAFLCSGSEAVEYGVRAAKQVAGKTRFLTMADSYFGAYGAAHSKEEDEWSCFDWQACADCPHDADCGPQCEHWEAIPRTEIGGFLFEPGSSSGFVRFPPEKLVRNLVNLVRENDGLVLVNEVTTGIGRTGTWFGHQHYGISPDVVAMGKGIGNGYPVSVAAFAPGVVERLGGGPIPYAQSHQNDPLGAAVAREVIRTIREENLIERGGEIATLLLSGLEGIRERTGRIAAIRSRGLMFALDLEDSSGDEATTRVHHELARHGYLVERRPGTDTLRIDPALTVERDDIEGFLETFESVLGGGPV